MLMTAPIACALAIATSLVNVRTQDPNGDLLAPVFAKRDATAKSKAKNWAEAETLWEKATTLNLTDGNGWLELGRTRYELKKYLEAIEPLQRAHDLGVSYAWDMPYFQACCYALGGKPSEALDRLEFAVNAGFRNLNDVRKDEDLVSLRNLPRYRELVDDLDVSKLDRTSGMTHDIRFFQREIKRLDYRERNGGNTGVDKFADQFVADLPNLSDNQVMVRFMKMASLMGDGHSSVFPAHESIVGLPVQFTGFPDGVYILSAAPDHKNLLGSRLVSIDGHSTEELYKACTPLFGQDNPQWVVSQAPKYFRMPRCLNGLGLSSSYKELTLELERDGQVTKISLQASQAHPDESWVVLRKVLPGAPPLTLENRDKNYWYKYIPESKTVFFQYNAVADDKEKSIKDFAKEMFDFIEAHDVDRMIMDIRWNGGGNNFLNKPLLLGLVKSKVNQQGRLFTIIGKNTFSAAMCFAEQVERFTNSIFAGEPTGSSPNFIGESIGFELRYSKMTGTISDLYWQNSVAMDHRIWISPEIYVPYTFASYSKQNDPVIDAIMAYRVP